MALPAKHPMRTQWRLSSALAGGRFKDEIAPVTVTDAKGRQATVDTDEHPRPDTTLESLKKLGPVFPNVEGQPGIITAATSSGITDGGAAVVLTSASRAKTLGV